MRRQFDDPAFPAGAGEVIHQPRRVGRPLHWQRPAGEVVEGRAGGRSPGPCEHRDRDARQRDKRHDPQRFQPVPEFVRRALRLFGLLAGGQLGFLPRLDFRLLRRVG
jgi:hypothetical protein